jgi:hypothetical protein
VLYRVLFRDQKSPRFWGFDSASAAHDWAAHRFPDREHVVRTEVVNSLVHPLLLRPTSARLRRPSALVVAVAALVVMAGLGSAVSGRSDDVVVRVRNATAPEHAVAQCRDGTYSENTEFWNTCRSAHGVKRWMAPEVLCRDGRVLELDHDASCGAAGVDRLVTD